MTKSLARAALVAFSMMLAVSPASLAAQSLSAALGYWTTTGGNDGESAAHGYRVHGALGVTLAGRPIDLEGAFSQAVFRRAFIGSDITRVNENSLEIAPLFHLRPGTPAWWPYAGPVASVGIGCGTAGNNDPNGRVACDTDSRSEGSVRLGLAAGVVFTKPAGAFSLTADLRLLANTIASTRGSGPVLLIAFGLR
ncbi:MAG: hypothetical protein ACYC5V_10395 [Gemmatimonadaceae bacterium]